MKLIYTHENRFIVSNIHNIIENAGIETIFKNEYLAGAAGDLAPLDTWLELWIKDDKHYQKAIDIINTLNSPTNQQGWICHHCNEKNAPSFEICWQCQTEKPSI